VRGNNPNTNLCLDLLGGHTGNLDWHSCRPGANQQWKYSVASGLLQPTAFAAGQCVTATGGGIRQAWVYTNGDSVELFLNGKSHGRQSVAAFDKGTWFLSYEAGNLTVVVTKAGATWETDTAKTASFAAAAALKLSVDMPRTSNGDRPLAADSKDVAILTVTVLDTHGRTVTRVPIGNGNSVWTRIAARPGQWRPARPHTGGSDRWQYAPRFRWPCARAGAIG
jgi:hypothetical protein